MSRDPKKFYTIAYDYLVSILPPQITEDRLNEYLVQTTNSADSLKNAFVGLIKAAQNYQFMPNVIKFKERKSIFEQLFHGFDYKYVAGINSTDLYYKLRESFNVTSPDSHYNSWYRWSNSVVDSATFVCEFSDIHEFDDYVKNSHNIEDVPFTISRKIRGIGFALACDTLKELGYKEYIKPDVHLKDIFEELGLCDRDDIRVFNTAMDIAKSCDITPYQLDKTLWLTCSGNYYMDEIRVEGRKKELISKLKAAL